MEPHEWSDGISTAQASEATFRVASQHSRQVESLSDLESLSEDAWGFER